MESLLGSPHLPIDRLDIVAKETDENGNEKRIVKRVIGLPGDTHQWKRPTCYRCKKTDEPYLKEYISNLKDKLQLTVSYRKMFQQIAEQANSFTRTF